MRDFIKYGLFNWLFTNYLRPFTLFLAFYVLLQSVCQFLEPNGDLVIEVLTVSRKIHGGVHNYIFKQQS